MNQIPGRWGRWALGGVGLLLMPDPAMAQAPTDPMPAHPSSRPPPHPRDESAMGAEAAPRRPVSPGLRRASAGLSALADRAAPAVVLLTILGPSGRKAGSGSGFFISGGGLIVTNHHVVQEASGMVATLSDGTKVEVQGLLARDPERDVAIIGVAGTNYPALRLGDSRLLKQGDGVVVVGSPQGLAGTLSHGIVSALRTGGIPDPGPNTPRGPMIQITAAISQGSSGSPVLNMDGEVIGVATLVFTSGQNLNFAVPVEAVADLLGTIGPDTKLQSLGPSPLRNLIISLVFFGALAAGYFGFRVIKRKRVAPRKPKPSLN